MTRVAGIDIERCTHCRTGRWRARRRYQWRTCPAGLARHRNRDGQSLNRRRVVATATRCPYIPHSTAAAAVQSNEVYLTRPPPRALGRIAGASDKRYSFTTRSQYTLRLPVGDYDAP